MKGLFITGTDTDCGKTRVSVELIRALSRSGRRVAPFKPVAAGAVRSDGYWINDDALALIEASGGRWGYAEVNPYCFEAPVSPHLAAEDHGQKVELERIERAARSLSEQADCVIVEGAGGWMVPLAPGLDIADLALALDMPVVLVVGMRLGCLNHARLSELSILQRGARLAGWIASQVDPQMQRQEDNLRTLRGVLESPFLGYLPWGGGWKPGPDFSIGQLLSLITADHQSK